MEQRLETLHSEIVADLKNKTNVFSSYWYSRHLYPNPLIQYAPLDDPTITLYDGGLGMGHYIRIIYDGIVYSLIGFTGPRDKTILCQSTDWDEMKTMVHTFFTGLLGGRESNTNGRTRDGTSGGNPGSGRGGTCETQGGVAGCGCTYGEACSGRRQVYSTQAQGGYGSYFRAGSPVPERKVVTRSS